MFGEDFIQRLLLAGPVILFSLTVHEFFHAWTANRFGDPTARNLGRMTLNPLAHLDFFGTLMLVFTQFRFGWAKPVPVNPMNMSNPRLGDIWVSAAGPLSNVGLAVVAGLLFRLGEGSIGLNPMFHKVLVFTVTINMTLAVFNLIPVFPLDGSHILRSLLPEKSRGAMAMIDRLGPIILIFLMFSGVLWIVLWPPVMFAVNLILGR